MIYLILHSDINGLPLVHTHNSQAIINRASVHSKLSNIMYVSRVRVQFKFIIKQSRVFQGYVRNKVSVSHDKNIVKSPFDDIQLTARTLDEYVWNNIDKWPNKVALKCGVTGQFYTYEELYKKSQIFAASLRKKLKVENGDCIALMLYNSPDYPIATLGCITAGCTITTINPVYTGHEVKRQLCMSNAKAIITDLDIFKNISNALNELEKPITTILINNSGSLPNNTINFNEFAEDVHVDKSILNNSARGLDDVCTLPYSSGTTGLPKGVELTARNLLSNCEQLNADEIATARPSVDHQDSVIAILPFFHIYAFTAILLHKLAIGSKVITVPKFQPATFLNALIKEEISLIYLAPPLAIFLAMHQDVTAEHFRSLKTIVSGAAPLGANDCKRILDRAQKKLDILQAYGLTETAPVITCRKLGCTKYASAGVALPNTEFKIVCQEKGQALGPHKVGEIYVRGPQVMKGYRNNPEATADAITPDKWFKTGDLGYYDADHELYLADRLKELIKVKGYQVPPAELEAVLRDHPDIEEAAVIGIPHSTAGETPKAFVVTKRGKNPSAESIMSFVKERVAPYKRLGEVQFIDLIPKNPSGKILRRVLKEQK